MPLPDLSNQTTKIISLTFFTITTILKFVCIIIINAQKESPCIAGWHVNEELSNHLLLISTGLVPDIIMLISIGLGMMFKTSNIGADPGTIIYNFIIGILNICALFPFFGIEDCKSDSLGKIKSVGIYATLAGILHIANGVVCLIFLAPEERSEPDSQPSTSNPTPSKNSEPKPSSSKVSSKK
ncbi:uncharacterized protein LOC111674799 [Lucilia cuprina]|uniref:uncharacterized protein LOC111674799 n=1 Tax=Lucilia cuprina TaxID=7375 RepID=UPI001F062A50|nr:uncharacterized protein LOC111674799 [Lucilia cuprina]